MGRLVRLAACIGCALLCLLRASGGHIFMKDGFVGIGIDLARLGLVNGKCPNNTHLSCPCPESDTVVNVTISVCSYSHRWKVKCKPCDDLQAEDICGRYTTCKHCFADGKYGEDKCAACPDGKFGQWCQNDCPCQNGAICEQDGKCVCRVEYEGRHCERLVGCDPPSDVPKPLHVTLTPAFRPTTAVFACPQDHELKGLAVVTCVDNQWSAKPPVCLPKCPLLSAPANGRLKFSQNELIEGTTAQVSCSKNHRLVGDRTLYCTAEGDWSGELPVCEKLAFCPDPGSVANAERTVLSDSVQLANRFVEDSIVQFKCLDGFQQMGMDTLVCRFNGTWSEDKPSCIKVSTVIPDCFTKGSALVSEEGVSVRILCPPECADEDFSVVGTSIYRVDSSACQAAIHSAKITNSGGPVALIGNGLYSHFTGSDSNNVESESYSGRNESFRFDRLPPMGQTDDTTACEKSVLQNSNMCVYVSNTQRNHKEAMSICSNLGLRLLPDIPDQRLGLQNVLSAKGLKYIWIGNEEKSLVEDTFNSSEVVNGGRVVESCSGVILEESNLRSESKNCQDMGSFVCIRKAEDLARCEDPGRLTSGTSKPVGQIDGVFYVGSSIEYSCVPQHYLMGAEEVSCLGNGTWSDPKPVCIKVEACEDPPVPIGGVVTYLPPLKTQTAQRVASVRQGMGRAGRFPVGLSGNFSGPPPAATPVATSAPLAASIPLPPGLHRVGSRAMFDCESRYYNLIGSRTRRCEAGGQWSGRPPTCMPVCGRSDSPKVPFIVNGNATDVGQWPWQAGLARYLPDYERWFLLCGGALLAERWVLTAAHCVTYAGTSLPIEPDKFQVYLGKYHRQDERDDDQVQVRKISEMHVHPDYDPGLFDADIALLQLEESVTLTSRVQPVCLPSELASRENLVPGKNGVVTGWGMDENSSYSETLRQAVLPFVSREQCEKGYEDSDLPLTVTDNMFCAGFSQGQKDACSGDSGGPMVFLDPASKERRWVLEGIVSWGSPQGCGNPNQYGGFTTVSRFLDWIHLFF